MSMTSCERLRDVDSSQFKRDRASEMKTHVLFIPGRPSSSSFFYQMQYVDWSQGQAGGLCLPYQLFVKH